jgi:hypothetical protein
VFWLSFCFTSLCRCSLLPLFVFSDYRLLNTSRLHILLVFSFFFYAASFPLSCFMCCLCQSSKGFSSNFFLRERKTYLLFLFLTDHIAVEFCYTDCNSIFYVKSIGSLFLLLVFPLNTIVLYSFIYYHCLLVFISAHNDQNFGLIAEREITVFT